MNALTANVYDLPAVKPVAVNEVEAVKEKIEVIVIYSDSNLMEKKQPLISLCNKALKNNIPFFVVGDLNELEELHEAIPMHLIKEEFKRPVNVKEVGSNLDKYIKNLVNESKKKILVVDDSGAVLRSVKGWLEHKYQVGLANSGAMAIKYLATNRPDLVLLDYEMPVINGKQLLEMIRSEAEFTSIPVIFLTGKNDKDSIQQVLDLKPEGYILKSTKPDQIVEIIDKFFAKTN